MVAIAHQIASISDLESQWPRHHDEWLSCPEQDRLENIRDLNRRREWLAGRWLCKQILHSDVVARQSSSMPFSEIEISSLTDRGLSRKPRVSISGQMQHTEISISHSTDFVAAVMSNTPGCRVGIDLVPQTLEAPHTLQLWLTPEEQQWVEADPDQVPILWAIKESVYKAANRGESFFPHDIEIYRKSEEKYACRWKSVSSANECSITINRYADHVIAMTTIQCPVPVQTL